MLKITQYVMVLCKIVIRKRWYSKKKADCAPLLETESQGRSDTKALVKTIHIRMCSCFFTKQKFDFSKTEYILNAQKVLR